MVHLFDPMYWNGTIFHLDKNAWEMARGWTEFERNNLPIPASHFPKSLTFDGASAALPDMFHTNRGIIVFSERARVAMEHWAPGQVEFIPVACHATPRIADRLKFASAYYFINVLGRAQRLQWLKMPTREFPPEDDGTVDFMLLPDFDDWKLRERAAGEPLIWRDEPWIVGNKRYAGHTRIFVEDVLWRELDANFPDQLNALRVGE
jgi:hypothetical protein